MKPGKIFVAEFPCRYLVVDVRGDPPARLLIARCRDFADANALAWAVGEQPGSIRGEVWYLHGNGKLRELELVLVRSVVLASNWTATFTPPQFLKARPLVLPTKGPQPT